MKWGMRSSKKDADTLYKLVCENAGLSVTELSKMSGFTLQRTKLLLTDYMNDHIAIGVFPTCIFQRKGASVWDEVKFASKEVK